MEPDFEKEAGLRLRQRNESRVGQGIVEFTLALPTMLLLLLGIIEFGRFTIAYIAISSASREAARFGAAAGDYDSTLIPPYENCIGIQEAASRVVDSFINLNDATITIQYDKGPGTAVFSNCPPGSGITQLGDRVVVRITATYEPLVPIGLQNIDLVSESMRTIMKHIVVD